MEYQKIRNLLENTSNQPSKFRTKNWIEINDQSRGTYNTNSDIRFRTTMPKSSLCDYSDVYIVVKNIAIVMPMYNLKAYSDNYSETSGTLWQYYRDKSNDNLTDSESFKSKIKIKGNTYAGGITKDVEIMVPLKCLSNF